MGDLLRAVKLLPIAILITTNIYLFYYLINKEKAGARPKCYKLAVYVFIGWWVMFIWITQIMAFGNGMGERINLSPLQPLVIARKYGLENAAMVSQLLLNILMFVPLGFLLPIVFQDKFNNFRAVLVVSFASSFTTEFIQYFTFRGTDIDDLITNTLGGVMGFALYILSIGIYAFVRSRKSGEIIHIERYKIKCIISVMLIIIILMPFGIIKYINSRSEYGRVYYGHLIPNSIELAEDISGEEVTGIVYKKVEHSNKEEIAERLNEITGFNANLSNNEDGIYIYSEKDNSFCIYEDNTWNVSYDEANYYQEISIDKIPNEIEGKCIAEEYLAEFQISLDEISYKGIDNNYGDEYLHLVYTPRNMNKDELIFGNISITIGEEGKLLAIYDNRIYSEAYKEIQLISPKDSIGIAASVGVGDIACAAKVTNIEADYYFNEKTGYIIPTWRIVGIMENEQGDTYQWNPNIEAIKY